MPVENRKIEKRQIDTSRRKLLKGVGAAGALSVTGQRVGASPPENFIDLDSILSSDNINILIDEIPELRLDREKARIYGKKGSIVAIPANYGKLIANVPNSNSSESDLFFPRLGNMFNFPAGPDNDVRAAFIFDEWVPGVSKAWSKNTEARLTVEGGEPLLQRSATDTETRQFLAAIDRPTFRRDETKISVIPEHDLIYFTHLHRDRREIEQLTTVKQEKTIQATQQRGEADNRKTKPELQVVDQTSQTPSETIPSAETSASGPVCDDKTIPFDVIYCIWDYSDCVLCTLGSPAPPVAIACWIIVCFDGGVALAMEALADWGCADGAIGGAECLADIVGEHGDDIPTKPTIPTPAI